MGYSGAGAVGVVMYGVSLGVFHQAYVRCVASQHGGDVGGCCKARIEDFCKTQVEVGSLYVVCVRSVTGIVKPVFTV